MDDKKVEYKKKQRAYYSKWIKTHPDNISYACRAYYWRNREGLLAKMRERYHTDPVYRKRQLETTKRWLKAHPKPKVDRVKHCALCGVLIRNVVGGVKYCDSCRPIAYKKSHTNAMRAYLQRKRDGRGGITNHHFSVVKCNP